MSAGAIDIVLRPALAAAGLALSLWMWRRSSGVRGLPGCGAGSGCDAVTHSRWSRWCGIPVAAPASLLYLALVGGFLFLNVSPPGRWRDMVGIATSAAAPLLAAAAVWFIALQWLAVRRLCLYCLLLHAIGLGIAGVVLLGPTAAAGAGPAGWGVAAAGVAALVLGQVLVEPRMYRVMVSGPLSVVSDKRSGVEGQLSVAGGEQSGASGNIRGSAALRLRLDGVITDHTLGHTLDIDKPRAQRSGAPDLLRGSPRGKEHVPSPADFRCGSNGRQHGSPISPSCCFVDINPFISRRITALGGKVTLEGGKWPVLGSLEAYCVLVYLFDYTCQNCRGLHRVLLEAMGEDEGAFAVMLVPVPHDPRCNPAIARPKLEHANACAYARLALSLWAADWTQYAAFDEFLFAGEHPPALGLARARAAAMLGRAVFDPTVPDAEIDPVIREGIAVYESVGPERTPTVLMPKGSFTGRVTSTKELWKILGGKRNTKSETRNTKSEINSKPEIPMNETRRRAV